MAREPLSPELKKAITELPSKEKDKLLFRLVKLKPDLVAQLQFLLLEDGATTEPRREELNDQIKLLIPRMKFYSHNVVFMQLRGVSGEITRHVKATKDKYGEVSLNLTLLICAFERFEEQWIRAPHSKQIKLNTYIVKKTQKTLELMSKLHEDYWIEFRSARNQVGAHFLRNDALLSHANQLDFQIDWLISRDVMPFKLPFK
jgi:hypothetical protein